MELSKEYAFVGLVTIEYALVIAWMAHRVGKARRKFQVAYPTMYARIGDGNIKDEKALLEYNCTQRAHQNSVENSPTFLSLLALASVSFPTYAAIAGQIWIVARIAYFGGYCTGDPKKRLRGTFGYIGLIGLLGMALATCIKPFL
ncbi:microsomal glutathione S-transferase 3 [Salpingoeca rosetta]|uniref:Glutathione S-transferase 3, mitochondrial n=1 Tax=Salpingoeca rosetta (strain ATCC 50818 / BSB-021) TaxID=946362 RepID=F2U7T1_SALR5|nr:microsomal glutathione S-transferase 3 [Salpingoeca rosetta]EGD72836.1 microsomal glutathione S-transferase 3 [Salpingoeca rosetta]|eukprot:XP_004994659.1 microsomal glutathione S-transferase 3 [Salpingoeca rosetta]